jgi:flagellar basal body-associated protein FliL
MGCGCKDKTVKSKEPQELTAKFVIKKIVAIILVFALVVVLTPLIVIMIWFLAIKMLAGIDDNYLAKVAKYLNFKKERKEIEEEINPDDYELLDVDIIE